MRRGPRAQVTFVHAPIPKSVHSLMVHVNMAIQPKRDWARQVIERQFTRAFQDGDLAHVWRGCSVELMRMLKARGHVIFLERVNAMDHMATRIIDDALARAGWPVEYRHDRQLVLDQQQAQAEAADYIFCANPMVRESLLERGIPDERILNCSYGWDPERFNLTERALPEIAGVTVLFVGSIEIRKGAHLLLNAWSKAGINGRLVLLGQLEPLIAKYCADFLSRDDVIHLPYDPKPGPVYRSADIFAFPTLEEGGPLVSYEAMGNGLPVVTSSVGAGDIIRHRKEGLVVDPHDEAQLIEALRQLAIDAEMRRALGEAGRIRAAEFTWDKVAQRRYDLIKGALARPACQR